MFDVPVSERFTVDLLGRIVLTDIRSTGPDVVGYYHIPEAVARIAPGDVRIDPPARPEARLRVRASSLGARAFADRGCRVPLTALAGEAGALTLEVRFRPAALAVLLWRTSPCPT